MIVGILCGGLMMMILPSFSDGETLLDSPWQEPDPAAGTCPAALAPGGGRRCAVAHEGHDRSDPHPERAAHQAVWSHHRLRRHNQLLNYLLHRQLDGQPHLGAAPHAATLARRTQSTSPMLAAVIHAGAEDCDKLRIARLMAP